MHRIDDSKFLLYIEPKAEEKSVVPIDDEISIIMEKAFVESQEGVANYSRIGSDEYFEGRGGWRGSHMTDCGERSSNKDYLLENGMITNSLCVFYLRYYRNSIPESEMKKVMKLVDCYK